MMRVDSAPFCLVFARGRGVEHCWIQSGLRLLEQLDEPGVLSLPRKRAITKPLTPDRKIELPDRRLYRVGEKVLAATVTVDSAGNVTVR